MEDAYRWTVRVPREFAERVLDHARFNEMSAYRFLEFVLNEWEMNEDEESDVFV